MSHRMVVRFSPAAALVALATASVALVLLSDGSTTPVSASPAEDEIGVAAGPLGGGQEFVPGELIVRFRPSVSAVGRSDLLANEGAQLSRDLLLPRHSLVKVPEGREDEFLARLAENPRVESVERNGIVQAVFTPNDYYYYLQWDMPQIEMPGAWDIADGSGVTVAVIDTGVAYENYSVYAKAPDLAGTCFVSGYDFVNGDSHPNDDNGHGTHVAGTIAETTNNGIGMAGVAPGACIMPVKVLADDGFGTYAGVADGISWATDHGASVINLSLTGGHSSSVEDAVDYALANDVVVVAATGNGGDDHIGDPAPGCPACYAGVLAVGATDYNMDRTYYSNYDCSIYGGCLDIMAPGGDVYAYDNGSGYPDGILQETLGIWCDPSVPPGDYTTFRYCFGAGTSMAAPHVAGAAALILEVNPSLTADEVRDVLTSTATDLGTPGYDLEYGYGLVNVYAAALMADDFDLDGVSNAEDNCPYDYNPDQTNSDRTRRPNGSRIWGDWASNPISDTEGDACDLDSDNDGLDDSAEYLSECPYIAIGDSDGDRSLDSYEVMNGSDPCDDAINLTCGAPFAQSDDDGLNDCLELRGYNSNPDSVDSDGDACPDWLEIHDLDGNRKVDVGDQLLLAKRAAGIIPDDDPVSEGIFDIDKNGKIDAGDQLLMAKDTCSYKKNQGYTGDCPCSDE